MGLITDIQQSIVDESISLTPTLRKAKILAYKLNNLEFMKWVDYELGGYSTEGETNDSFLKKLPDYRKGIAPIYADVVGRNQLVSDFPIHLIDDRLDLNSYRILEGISSLEKANFSNNQLLCDFLDGYEVAFINQYLQAQKGYSCLKAWRQLSGFQFISVVETVRDRLLGFTLALQSQYPDLDDDVLNKQIISNEKVSQVFHITVQQGASMATFDQRGQNVKGDQYNAARDINFSGIQTQNKYIEELEKLQDDLSKAVKAGELEEGAATDAEYQITKAVQEAKKQEPDKSKIKTHLEQFGGFIKDVASLAPLVLASSQAIQILDTIF